MSQINISKNLILLMYAVTLGTAGISKLSSLKTPDWFLSQFKSSVFNLFDGALSIQYFSIAFIEVVIFLFAVFGIFTKVNKNKIIKLILVSSTLLFISLSFGQRITYKFDSAAILFFYACASILLLINLFKIKEKI